MEELHVLLVLMVVVWVIGKIFRAFSLPVIFGELLGGIIVGPLVLGLVSPDDLTVKVLAELGIFFLMLHAGLETDPHELFKSSKKSVLVALGGVLVPFVTGYFVSVYFGQSPAEALFIAVGLSITAIAISVRLFKDYGIQRTTAAHITIGAAVIDDILAMFMFSIVLSVIESGSFEILPILLMLLKTFVFFAVVIFGGLKTSKYLNKFLRSKGFTFTLIVALSLGYLAELVGLHMIIGAFLAGLFVREEVIDEKIFNKIEDRIYGLSYSFLGPIFFTSLAFHLDFTAVYTRPWFLLSILVVATLGKVIGAGGGAFIQKVSFKQSAIIGLAMNSRGAVELIIASIGLRAGIIDQDVFSILVIMAFFTTMFSIAAMKPFAKYVK